MKEYVPVIASIIVGIFAVISAFMAWKFKSSSDKRRNEVSLSREKYDEVKLLYITTFQLFEEAMKQVLNRSQFNLSEAFSKKVKRGRYPLIAEKP